SNSDEKDLLDVYHPKINIEKNSKWICKEVTLLTDRQRDVEGYGDAYYAEVGNKYRICYVFTNDKNETFVKEDNPIYPEIRDHRGGDDYHAKYFITEKEFMKNEQVKNKGEQLQKSKNDAATAKEKADAKARYEEFVKKYGKANADLVASGQVRIGFTKEMCVYAWGPLCTPSTVVNDQGTLETWRYSAKQVLYFVNGILKQIEQ
ncbi:MAG TPA: hypothetical protein VF411_10485, partial [Bacteroidia bacterium]